MDGGNMRHIKKGLKIVLGIIAGLIGLVVLYFVFMTVTDYKPAEVIQLEIENNKESKVQLYEESSLLIYNIGYGGLDKGRDFFMDGGTEARSISKEQTLKNIEGIAEFIKERNASSVLLQEVDLDSTRSHYVDEYAYFKENIDEYSSSFATNYKVPWVPVPLDQPHGMVESGLASFSKYNVSSATRYQYPGDYPWPKQLAMLDRCFVEMRHPVENGKELVIVNSHLSAYDKGGTIRKQQLAYLKEYIKKENDKGNYIIIGGDWNHLIPGTDPMLFETVQDWPDWLVSIPDDFLLDGFQWAADKTVATSRALDVPYQEGVNFRSVIDGFLVSPNIEVIEVKGYDLGFEYADHNPIVLKYQLKSLVADQGEKE